MDTPDKAKLALGALLVGASALSGNALLATTAAGIGVNWASEALGGVIAAGAPALQPGTPLARAYERAMRSAVNNLRRTYQSEHGRQSDTSAFALLGDTAGSVAQAEFPAVSTVGAAQQELTNNLDALLHGHDERQVAFIKARLLEQVARAFQEQLAADDEAWRLFHGWLIQATSGQSAALQAHVQHLPAVLDQLRDTTAALDALHDSSDRLEALLAELRRIALGVQPGPAPRRSHTQTISGNAQVGVAVAGDVHGPVTNQTGGINLGSGNTISNTGDIFGGDKVMGNKTVNYGAPHPADTSPVHLRRLIDLHTRRLRVLEEQAALTGINTRPEVQTEIEDIRTEIARLEALLRP